MNETQLIEQWFSHKQFGDIEVLNHGYLNTSDGPDILNAEIEILSTRYSGNIEIDYKKSFWLRHGHFQNRLYESTLLHFYNQEDSYEYQGFHPKYSYNAYTSELKKIKSLNLEFKERKLRLFNSLSHLFIDKEIISILLARTLGLHKNRDVMMYYAIRKFQNEMYSNHIENNFKKSVRPMNQYDKRTKQYDLLENEFLFSKKVTFLIYQRYDIKKILNEFKGYPISKNRTLLYLYNYLIPYLLFNKTADNQGFILYLNDFFKDLKAYSYLKNMHSDLNELIEKKD